MGNRSLLAAIVRDFRYSWKELALTDIAYKVIAFIALTPFVGVLFRILMGISGKPLLADQDILFFFLGPVGWVIFVVVGGIGLGIVALEQAALMGILYAAADEKRLGVVGALHFAAATARPVILVMVRLVAYTLLTLLPLLAVISFIYATLLGDHDINFYLNEKPPVFWVAISLASIAVVTFIAILLRLIVGWFFALPLVVFEDIGAATALRTSAQRSRGHRWTLLFWIVTWGIASMVLSSLAFVLVVFVGRLLVPHAVGSLGLLVAAIGVMLVLWALVTQVVNLLSTTIFATLLFNLYRNHGSFGAVDSSRLPIANAVGGSSRIQITPLRLVVASVIGIAIAVAIGAGAIETIRLEDRTEIMAHRGSSAVAPENTMAAIKQAILDGADWVEIDVQETADGEVVVFHDSDFMKLARVDLKIWNAKLADLKDIDIGSWFSPEFKDQRVPVLGDVLDACKGKIGVNIELKYYGHDDQLEQRVVELVESHDMTASVVIMSLSVDAVEKMKSIRPDWKVGLLMSVSAGDLNKLDADFLAVNARFANRPFIHSAHDLDKEVYVWTVNDAPTMSAMMSRGVDSLITDRPALARSVLKQRAEMSSPERLLLELAGMFGVVPKIGEP